MKRFHSWLRATLQRQDMEREMEEELRFHVETYVGDLVRGGVDRDEAERRARLEFGNVGQTKEACR